MGLTFKSNSLVTREPKINFDIFDTYFNYSILFDGIFKVSYIDI